MIRLGLQDAKLHQFARPIDGNGTTLTDIELDTAGYDYLDVIVATGNVAADMTALKWQESDASGSGEADISGASWSTLPLATGGDNTLRMGHMDLRKRKRYISLVATAGSGATLISALGILTRSNTGGQSATDRGLAVESFIL